MYLISSSFLLIFPEPIPILHFLFQLQDQHLPLALTYFLVLCFSYFPLLCFLFSLATTLARLIIPIFLISSLFLSFFYLSLSSCLFAAFIVVVLLGSTFWDISLTSSFSSVVEFLLLFHSSSTVDFKFQDSLKNGLLCPDTWV